MEKNNDNKRGKHNDLDEKKEEDKTEKQFKAYEDWVSGRGWLHAMGIEIKKKGE